MAIVDFWQGCIDSGCVIVPVRLYSEWGEDGNIDQSKLIGTRFVALPNDDGEVVASEGAYLMIDESISGLEHYHTTPDAALLTYRQKKGKRA